ncbi:hypothetical protein [Legionella clemsonensis]|uniref:Coiled-coil protein n=1 Tax=Legionella clemsonensis TaxID=1867846 RepID=A0A222P2T2_9GAMM|nr:hypothetical protein [Legionella clemsonensis]ASQ46160.1 hypothetical protein clem_08040 [Legionella clemsonensis]
MLKINQIKHNFFTRSPSQLEELQFKESDFDLKQLNLEFSSTYQLFISNKGTLTKESELLLYLNYLCEVMMGYYQLDYVEADLSRLLLKKKEIEQFIKQECCRANPNKTYSVIYGETKKSTSDCTLILTRSSRCREYTSTLITNCSYWNYSRSLANYLIIYLQENGFAAFMKTINEKIGPHYSLQAFMKWLDKPQKILRLSSIMLYVFRFMTNLMVLLKHVINAAISNKLSSKKVLTQEIEKRGFTMANDMVWGSVNLLSNYNRFFQLSSLIIAQINLAFLVFDLALFIVHWSVDRRDYSRRVEELKQQKREVCSSLEQAVISRQLDIMHDEWKVECAYYQFNIVAASLLIVAFAATLIGFGPLALGVFAALSMFGNALYNTSDEYKKYKQASISVSREKSNGKTSEDDCHYKLLHQLHAESLQANKIFWKTLIFNTTATACIITAAAISWPIACILTVSYLTYRIFDNYQQTYRDKDKKKLSYDIYRLFKADNSITPVPKREIPVEFCCQ